MLLSPCFAAQGREVILQGTSQGVGISTGMQIPAWNAWVPALPGVPQGHPVPAASSCPHSAPTQERAGTGPDSDEMAVADDIGLLSRVGTSFCRVRAMSLLPVLMLGSHTGVQLPLRRLLPLCSPLVPLVDPVPKSCPKLRSHACILSRQPLATCPHPSALLLSPARPLPVAFGFPPVQAFRERCAWEEGRASTGGKAARLCAEVLYHQ